MIPDNVQTALRVTMTTNMRLNNKLCLNNKNHKKFVLLARKRFQDVNSWDFDVYHLQEVCGGSSLRYIGLDLFNKYGLLAKYRVSHQ